MNAFLHAEGLQAFYGASQVLHGIDLTVRRGDCIALIGRNGMGKTTLLRTLMGLVSDRKGRVTLDGADIVAARPEEISRRGVALVPEGRCIFGSLTVVENLTMAHRPGPRGDCDWTLERVFALFPRLKERKRNGGQQLSGGEQQMLAIGRALMTNPELILIDEATEGLAPLIAQEIWRTLNVIAREGMTAIVVDKDYRSLSRLADQVVVLSKGTVVYSGTPGELSAQPEVLERHLGV